MGDINLSGVDGVNQQNGAGASDGIQPSRQKPKSDGRSRTSAVNGRLGGRPRGTVKTVDQAKWNRLFLGGASAKSTADALGISIRTLKRRIREFGESE